MEIDERHSELRLVRRYAETLLVDQIPAAPEKPAPTILLDAFTDLAQGFDLLHQQFPAMSFFYHPHNLLWNGEGTTVADFGVATLFNATENVFVNEGPVKTRHVEQTAASWKWVPTMQDVYNVPSATWERRVEDIPPIFALASLYFFLRTGHGPFKPNFEIPDLDASELEWENEPIALRGFKPEWERDILKHAFHQDFGFTSCEEFVHELRMAHK